MELRQQTSSGAAQPARRPAQPAALLALTRPLRRSRRAPDAGAASSSGRREANLAEYAQLKRDLLRNTAGTGLAVALYLALTQDDLGVAGSVALGTGGGVAYLALLCRHVDGLGGAGDALRRMPLNKNPGENLGALLLGAVKRVADIYWCAARPCAHACTRTHALLRGVRLGGRVTHAVACA